VLAMSLALLSTVGCFRYVPESSSTLTSGQTLRVELSPEGARLMTSQLGPDIRVVTGVVRQATADTLTLEVKESKTATGQALVSSGNTVAIPRVAIAVVERREAAPKKTLLTLAMAALAAGLLSIVVGGSAGGSGTPGGPVSPPV
jgi:hypothetical protein